MPRQNISLTTRVRPINKEIALCPNGKPHHWKCGDTVDLVTKAVCKRCKEKREFHQQRWGDYHVYTTNLSGAQENA